MKTYPQPLQKLIKELARFPGIGEKTAARLANFILHESEEEAKSLAFAIIEVKEKIKLCRICYNLAEGPICSVCADAKRDRGVICVVEDPDSLMAIEETNDFNGVYHVLHGSFSPLDGVGPEDLRLKELLTRVEEGPVKEVIVATHPTTQGEATAVLIGKSLKEKGVKVTRIALGVPVGGDLRYMDRLTLGKALSFRRSVDEG
ncbi:MAG: recombination mediator RecR [Syntrophales bacterium]|nr:recombination mediator RecR [Syntrophales bacterium]